MRRIAVSLGIVAGGLLLASPALAGWGEDWGTMVWGAAPVGVPTLGLLGFGLLSLALAAGAVFSMRRRAWTMSVLLVALAIPLAAVASPITGLNVFSNGTTADANEVNANFNAVDAAVDDNDSRISGIASYLVTSIVPQLSAAQDTADTAATAVATEATARAATDTLLQTAIDSETASRSGADSALDTRITAVESGTFSSGINVDGDAYVSGDFNVSGISDFDSTILVSGDVVFSEGSLEDALEARPVVNRPSGGEVWIGGGETTVFSESSHSLRVERDGGENTYRIYELPGGFGLRVIMSGGSAPPTVGNGSVARNVDSNLIATIDVIVQSSPFPWYRYVCLARDGANSMVCRQETY